MSKTGALIRGLLALVTFIIHTTLRWGLNIGVLITVVICIQNVGEMSKDALKRRKEVLDLIYWRDPRKSAVVLVATLAVLICLSTFTLLTVVSYAGLTLLAVTLSFRVYKTVLAQIQKTDSTNPFQPYLEKDLALPQERVHQQVDVLLEHAQQVVRQLRRLFLVEDIVDTIKFGLLLWALTYVGANFSGLTLVVLALLGVFTIPKFYEVYKEPIDKNLGVVKGHVDQVTTVVQDKLPFLKKKQQ